MKKLCCALCVMLLLAGCKQSKDEEIKQDTDVKQEVVLTPTPVTETPEPTSDAEHSFEDETVDLGEDTEVIEQEIVDDTVLEASFIEDTDINPTTLTFYQDGRVSANLNVCSGMAALSGVYTKQEETVLVELLETGYDFLEHVQFEFNLIEDKLMLSASSDMFSCAGIDTYSLRKAEEE